MIDIHVMSHERLFNLNKLSNRSAIIIISDVGTIMKKPPICDNRV